LIDTVGSKLLAYVVEPFTLIATDLDGTLLRDDGTISPRSRRALHAAQEAGLTVVFVTARPPRHVRALADDTGLTGVAVCANGAILYDIASRRFLRHERLAAELARDLIDALRASHPDTAFATEHGHKLGYEPGFPQIVDDLPDRHVPRLDHAHRLCDEEVTKLLVHHPIHDAHAFAEIARVEVGARAAVLHSGGGPFIEIAALGVSKANGLRLLCEHLGVQANHVIAFGDMPNDLPMLQFAGHAVAVANAHAEVLAAADEVTTSNQHDGVARSIELLLDGRGQR
jgi:Cof subfamily protein (haloacid dehalogenase superfamily)